jgi:hypothetical protein
MYPHQNTLSTSTSSYPLAAPLNSNSGRTKYKQLDGIISWYMYISTDWWEFLSKTSIAIQPSSFQRELLHTNVFQMLSQTLVDPISHTLQQETSMAMGIAGLLKTGNFL